MNHKQTRPAHKALALALALLLLFSALPLQAFATDLTPAGGQPADEQVLSSADVESTPTALGDAYSSDANGVEAQDAAELQYRIVHLDCGRKYFSVDYIKGVIDTMAANGYNQLELAFGNGGLRFLLDDMDLTYNGTTLFYSEQVKAAIQEGNKNFYDCGTTNELTEKDMREIAAYAQKNGVEIVPLLNMPGHMDGVLSSSLFSQYKLSDSEGSLDLNNSYAVDFGKALLSLYVDWFRTNTTTKYFNFGADEYGQGIRNPYIESSVAKVTYNQLINYMNDCAGIIEGQSMTARCFNDFVCYNNRSDCNLYKTVQVCYWSNQWNGSEYNTPDVIQAAGYKMINTSQKWYFVPSKASEYGKDVVLNNLNTFDVTKFQNIKSGYNYNSTTYTQIPVGTTNVGAMFCVWADTPSVDIALADVQDLIAAMATANPDYFGKTVDPDPNPDPGEIPDVTISLPDDMEPVLTVGQSITLSANRAVTWSVPDDGILTLSAARTGTKSSWENNEQVQVTAQRAGTATVTASVDGMVAKTLTLTVNEGDTPVEPPEQRDISLAVGDTTTLTVPGKLDNYGTYDTTPAGIATAKTDDTSTTKTVKKLGDKISVSDLTSGSTASGVISDGKGNYLVVSGNTISSTTKIDDATIFTVTASGNGTSRKYRIQGNARYLTVTQSWQIFNGYVYSLAVSTSRSSWRYSDDAGFNDENYGYYLVYGSSKWSVSSSSSNAGFLYSVTSEAVPDKEQYQISFTGVAEGTTHVTIGNVRYTINVAGEDLTKVTLPINLWITNTGVVPTGWSNRTPAEFTYSDTDGNRRSIYTLKASYTGVYSETGIELSSILPKGTDGLISGKATSWDSNIYDVVYWKSAYHTAAERQSTAGWTNNSHLGTQFKYIRYWNDAWSYSVDGTTWVAISNVGAAAADTTKNQVNIWYRQKTKITDEVRTEIVDWGPIKYGANQCLLDFAVKYESGELTPGSFPVSGKTMGFDCPTNQSVPLSNGYVVKDTDGTYYRTVYGLAGVEPSEYEVYMITVTPSSDSHTTYINKGTAPSSYEYRGTEKIAWAKTEADAANAEKPTTSNIKYGGEPFLDSVKIYQYQGLLVTYYVRAKQTDDSLGVHYIDESTGEEFYSYNIVVDSGTVFKSTITLDSPEWKKELKDGDVINKKGETQTVNANLSTMPDINAQYRYVDYTCMRVERQNEGKDVYLYYNFTSRVSFVVDFGLPLTVKPGQVHNSLENATITGVSVTGQKYGNVATNNDHGFTYTLKQIISDTDNLTVTYTGNLETSSGIQTGSVKYDVRMIPASTVYYEDSFVNYYPGTGSAANATWTTAEDGSAQSAEQAVSKLGDAAIYGYDKAYESSSKYSMGSAQKVTVTSNMLTGWDDSTSAWPSASFTFKGTGFDIISLTDNTSGTISVDVYKGSTASGTAVKKLVVDNYYGYKQDGNKWVVDPDASDTLYQIPVMKVENLPYGEYTAVIKVFYNSFFDHQGHGSYSFWLDAIRIYNPMGKDYTNYELDKEGHPQYIRLQKELSKPNRTGVVFIDGKADATISQYANYGPNNEVYLAKGQAISFELSGNISDIASVQIGAKAPKGNATMNVSSGSVVENLTTATEQYYDISAAAIGQVAGDKNNRVAKQVTITNTGDGILSLTNLKVTFKTSGKSVSLKSLDADQQAAAVMAVRALYAAPAETFTPARFEASWSRAPRAGGKTTLTVKTSEDVASVTVNGEAITNYRTRTESTGWLWNRKTVTYREFTYTVTNAQPASYTVAAVNASGVASDPITAKLTVRPTSNWWDRLTGWF